MNDFDDLEEDASLADQLSQMKQQRDKLARQLYETKHKHADYLTTVWNATQEAIAGQTIRPVRPPRLGALEGGDGPEEVAVALLSDLQTGKVTPDYNSDVCRERVMAYARKIVKITNVQRADHPVNECVVPLLGDLVEGVNIFAGQEWLIDSTLYRQMFDTTPTIIVDFLRYLLAHFDRVRIEGVQGNHGRIGRPGQYGPEDNSDRMVMRIIKLMMRDEPRLEFNMADPAGERAWYKIMHIGNYSALLIHGDQIRGSMGLPWYGYAKKVHSWASGGLGPDQTFQDVMSAHYHQLARIPLNHRVIWANGSTESSNAFAAETLAGQSDPMQWLLYVRPDQGVVTASYGVRL